MKLIELIKEILVHSSKIQLKLIITSAPSFSLKAAFIMNSSFCWWGVHDNYHLNFAFNSTSAVVISNKWVLNFKSINRLKC